MKRQGGRRRRTVRFHPQNRRASPVPPAMAKSRIGKSGHVARLEGRIPPPTADERGRKPRKQRSAGDGGALRGDCGLRGSINANGRFHHRFPNRPASFRDGARTSDGLKAASPSAVSKTGAPACRKTTLQTQARLTFQTVKKVAVKPAGCNEGRPALHSYRPASPGREILRSGSAAKSFPQPCPAKGHPAGSVSKTPERPALAGCRNGFSAVRSYSTVTDLARFRGLSTSRPCATAI